MKGSLLLFCSYIVIFVAISSGHETEYFEISDFDNNDTCCEPHVICCNELRPCCLENYVCCQEQCYEGDTCQCCGEGCFPLESVCCDNGGACASGYTCCDVINGDGGCCPPEYVCCESGGCCGDGLSCCEDNTCCSCSEPPCDETMNQVSPRTYPAPIPKY